MRPGDYISDTENTDRPLYILPAPDTDGGTEYTLVSPVSFTKYSSQGKVIIFHFLSLQLGSGSSSQFFLRYLATLEKLLSRRTEMIKWCEISSDIFIHSVRGDWEQLENNKIQGTCWPSLAWLQAGDQESVRNTRPQEGRTVVRVGWCLALSVVLELKWQGRGYAQQGYISPACLQD